MQFWQAEEVEIEVAEGVFLPIDGWSRGRLHVTEIEAEDGGRAAWLRDMESREPLAAFQTRIEAFHAADLVEQTFNIAADMPLATVAYAAFSEAGFVVSDRRTPSGVPILTWSAVAADASM